MMFNAGFDIMKKVFDLKDGSVVKIYYNSEQITMGCPTCGYGAKYIDWIIIELTNYTIKYATDNSEGKLSDFDLIQLFGDISHDMTEFEFVHHVIDYMNDFEEFTISITKNDFDGVTHD